MKKPFIHDDFMLQNEQGKKLYHEYAKDMPIIDFHCHLSPKEISENHRFSNIAEIWLHGDHYKWRAMRALGFPEEKITGKENDHEKFRVWAESVPHTLGNPLYHWTHLELTRYFNVDQLLHRSTAEEIWKETNRQLQEEALTTQDILKKSRVEVVCTTDDPLDTLQYHEEIAENTSLETRVLPTFRPDKAIEIQLVGFNDYIDRLSASEGGEIRSYKDLKENIRFHMDRFQERGCASSDHGIQALPFIEASEEEAAEIFSKRRNKETLSSAETEKFRTHFLLFLGEEYHRRGWVMQLHLGALRNNNEKGFAQLGPDTGFDSMDDAPIAEALNGFLNALNKHDVLPKTIIYNLNPVHNEVIATAIGNFQAEGVKGKLQLGSGWWFNDQKTGMLKQLRDLANHGLLSTFVGMLTDSRSFLSYTRHEYFRRILCNMLGEWMECGEIPEDYELAGKMVEDICYYNAKKYFGLTQKAGV
ncbi:glucuronate isomerase [Alkalicoccus daliensis]|uniref:Uronate isomerase n=1 Tax=Alkalicoccus daliensis TaxID=745820 RepID=A0A1H0EZ11_9BACI|nr:glucuronate isomerase [Alkalicoccus daliensis]SDN87581.1 glucuronate isomerase [Alkalicoccus daliensis]